MEIKNLPYKLLTNLTSSNTSTEHKEVYKAQHGTIIIVNISILDQISFDMKEYQIS